MTFPHIAGWLVAGLTVLTASAQAQVYQCRNAAGQLTYTDQPCASGNAGGRVEITPNAIDMSAGREAALREENQRLRQQLEQQQATPPAAAAGVGRTAADLQAEKSSSPECRQAQREQELVAGSSAGPRRQRAAEQAMRLACGLPEPTREVVREVGPAPYAAPYSVPLVIRPRPQPAPPQPLPATQPAVGGFVTSTGQFCANAVGGVACPTGNAPSPAPRR